MIWLQLAVNNNLVTRSHGIINQQKYLVIQFIDPMMNSERKPSNSDEESQSYRTIYEGDRALRQFAERLSEHLENDQLVQQTTEELRSFLNVDRVVIYYFYREWKGQVTFEALSNFQLSIFGSTGPDGCFNDEYAALYKARRIRAIADIETEPIATCHRDFLRSIQVRANLVVPILTTRLWGLLIAHHCQNPRHWIQSEIEVMQQAAHKIETAPTILKN